MRPIGWLVGAMMALAPLTAYASTPFAPVPDLRTTLLLRLFGEVSDSRTSLVAMTAQSESPLRDAAFVVSISGAPAPIPLRPSIAHSEAAPPSVPAYVAPQVAYFMARSPAAGIARARVPLVQPVTSAYEAAPESLFEGDANTSAFSFNGAPASLQPDAAMSNALDGTSTDSTLEQSVQVPVALRVGNLRVLAGFNAGLSTNALSGVDNTLPVFVPAYAGVSRSSLGANVAVPVAPRLMLGLGYNTERLVTGYGVPTTLDGLDARNDTYSGNVTFLFPRLGSALSLSAQQYRYQDNLIPAEFTQLREDLNLTVKF